MFKTTGKILLLLSCMFLCAVAQADTLWNNGTPSAETALCNDCSNAGYTTYDNFQLTENANITGFTFVSNLRSPANTYSTTNWYLWNAEPTTASVISSPIASGSNVAILSLPDGMGFTTETIQLSTAINLAAGTYWIGFSNQGSNLVSTPVAVLSSPLPSGAGQINVPGQFFNTGSPWDFAFSVEGYSGASPVPEPASLVLLGSGLSGLAGIVRKRRATN